MPDVPTKTLSPEEARKRRSREFIRRFTAIESDLDFDSGTDRPLLLNLLNQIIPCVILEFDENINCKNVFEEIIDRPLKWFKQYRNNEYSPLVLIEWDKNWPNIEAKLMNLEALVEEK